MAKKNAKKPTTKKATDNGNDFGKRPSYVDTDEEIEIPSGDSGSYAPQIKLLQTGSPEVEEGEAKSVKGATAGDMVVTNGDQAILVKKAKGIKFIPIAVRKKWLQWTPREKGGGFVGDYNTKEEAQAAHEPGNEIKTSLDYLVACPDINPEGDMEYVVLSFNSPTKMAIARQLEAVIQEKKTMQGVMYLLGSVKVVGKKGTYYNYTLKAIGWTGKTDNAAIEAAKEDQNMKFLPVMDDSAF